MILIASERQQLEPFLLPLTAEVDARVRASWPGPVTWLLPARAEVPYWLRGEHRTLAVRVTAHPLAAALCEVFGGPIVSTSANLAGHEPARSALRVQRELGDRLDYILHGPLGELVQPTEIRDARNRAHHSRRIGRCKRNNMGSVDIEAVKQYLLALQQRIVDALEWRMAKVASFMMSGSARTSRRRG